MLSNFEKIDLVIIGAGPAGINAAILAKENNLSTILIDDQNDLGGQVYRSIGKNFKSDSIYLGKNYHKGRKLYETFNKSKIKFWKNTSVWQISEEKEVFFIKNGTSGILKTKFVLICCGAIERPMPISGWTLPGVMTVGGAQTILKSSGTGVDNAVFIGSGPLLYLSVFQYLKAGFRVKAVLDTTDTKQLFKSIPFLLFALSNIKMIFQGIFWIQYIIKKSKFIPFVNNVELNGEKFLENITFTNFKRKEMNIDTKNAFIHHGVIPNINLTMATGIKHKWNKRQFSWLPNLNYFGETNISGIYVAGDNMGIGGEKVSSISSSLSLLDILEKLQKRIFIKKYIYLFFLNYHKLIRPFLDVLFKPNHNLLIPTKPNGIVCRCENITKKELIKSIKLGVSGPNQLKAYSRAGMGKCQGRYCGNTVQLMISKIKNLSMKDVGYYRLRPPIKPLTLEQLSNFKDYFIDED